MDFSRKHSVGWRHVLPLFLTTLYVGLMYWGLKEQYGLGRIQIQLLVPEGQPQFDPHSIDRLIPWTIRLADALNLPAILPGSAVFLVVSAVLKNLGPFGNDVLACVSLGIFIPALWYCAGWVIDDRMGHSPPKPWRLSRRWRETIVAIALITCLPLFGLGLLGLIASASLGATESIEVLCGLVGWTGWISWSSLRSAIRFWRQAGVQPTITPGKN